ncbi:ATP synthase F1, delta subunit [Alkaliphilus metalliredigens QYMF]|uniref:ATP synthase subunit delta n=1 Tax=Alkaliphilus metalliredigens (strain QYMF) TaxID=293826 RepID=ATPD_ALKMQ|nr:F0F1 ATP synthase subunit delta [Alkaliphilus metalliredigens]A6TK62.1 RecName: Full=ATP synthase subunit delta; AltName: Full=ATP synthase F(1) sector subunit delta; AltName: Full=F-type ATPase subunit delta; Short=F-ATPase subunit delta [Alkaliphilus metalliredigens QYMF]ABR46580.1 ATP synthase F1, delta subunit [Alkaliphilus metalliredigens QYMF]
MAELVAKRYAKALFQVAFEMNRYEDVTEELAFVAENLKQHSDLNELLKSPVITLGEKKEILSTIFKEQISPEVFNFLRILLDKSRQGDFQEIYEEYKILADAGKNKIEAVAITALPMDNNDLLKLQVNLSMSSGKNVKLKNEIDPTVIGGVLVKMGDKIIDGTVKARLNQMQDQLLQIIV